MHVVQEYLLAICLHVYITHGLLCKKTLANMASSELVEEKARKTLVDLPVPVPVLIPSVVTSRPTTLARLPIHLTTLLLRTKFGFADHCARF